MSCLEGATVRLRAVEPADAELMYAWENDCDLWPVSQTTEPFSRHTIERFISLQTQHDIIRTGQLRLMIETLITHKVVGALDLFDYDHINRRAGVGILIYNLEDRGLGYASDAVATACRYASTTLRLHQLWASVRTDNQPSLAVFLRAGFEQTGLRRDWHSVGDSYIDEAFFQKTL